LKWNEREKRKYRRIVKDIIFNWGNKSSAVKVLRLCPLVLLVKVG
jgi:hypothetical protein